MCPQTKGPLSFAEESPISRYRLTSLLDGGGRGSVIYRAVDLDRERLVSLKLVAAATSLSQDERHLLLREVQAICGLEHPNLCPVYEAGETGDGLLFVAMGAFEGVPLRERIAQGPLEIETAVDLAVQIADGLAFAHEAGIAHGCLRPSAILVTAEGRARIFDFGFGRLADLTLAVDEGGEPDVVRYTAPEQLAGREPNALSDLWSLGAILYEMVTGRPAFLRGPLAEPGAPRTMSTLREGVPAGLEEIVARALARRLADRLPGAREMRSDLAGNLRSGRKRERPPQEEIGPYRLQDLLGGGGMGLVYRAEDTRLGRTVALKLLPPELTRDALAKARFLQEARTASALDHPNLCTIYEVGETSDGQLYLAMPCYPGETLRRRIERQGRLPVTQALEYTAQILKALAKVHGRGIVHRDIKPANLMITEDGVVKILDFGIAKLIGSMMTTTRTGALLGTPAYMAPEQQRGEDADGRMDLWAVGMVFYEMLAGTRPSFPASAKTLSPGGPQPPVRSVRPDVPPKVEGVLRRLLAMDREDRYPTAEAALEDFNLLLGNSSGPRTGAGELVPIPRRALRLWAVAAVALVIAGAVAGYRLRWGDATAKLRTPLQARFVRLTDQEGQELFPSPSPDGGYFAYAKVTAEGSDIYLQRIGGGNPINLTPGTPWEDTQPTFSPDSEKIAFRSDREGGGIFIMGATGESVRRLTDFGHNPSWSPDSREIAVATEGITDPASRFSISQIWRVDAATGERRLIVEEDAVQPAWSPSGKRIAYWGVPVRGGRRTISTVAASGGSPVRVTNDGFLNWNPVWSSDGRFLYFASDRSGSMNLWRVPIDESSGRLQGEPEPLTTPSTWSAMFSLAPGGRRILYVNDTSESNLERYAFDPDAARTEGPPAPVIHGTRNIGSVSVSPDERWITFQVTSPREDIFVAQADGSAARQLTDDLHKDRLPRWSPDGRQIAFYSNRSGRYEIWTIRPDGSDLRQVTRTTGPSVTTPVWSPDGKRMACGISEAGSGLIDLTLPVGARVPRPFPRIGGKLFSASSWSSDGKWLAGSAQPLNSPPSNGIFLYSLDSRRYRKLTDRGRRALWIPGSQRLLVWGDRYLEWVDAESGEVRRVNTAPPSPERILGLGISPEQRSLFLVRTVGKSDIWMLTLEE